MTSPAALCRAFAALALRRIGWPSLLLWAALLEARVRATFDGAGTVHVEAARLLGGRWTARSVARGEAELARLGLVEVEDVVPVVDVELDARSTWMQDQLGHDNPHGGLGIPRRHLRWFLRQCKPAPALAATWAAHILRGALAKRARKPWWNRYRTKADFRGCARAAWIARVFGVDQSRVHGARRRLIRVGLFREVRTSWQVRQHWGVWLVVRPGMVPETRAVASPTEKKSSNATPLKKTRTRLKYKNQGTGRFQRGDKISWHRIRNYDLREPGRQWRLYQAAVEVKAIGGTDADRVLFFGALARAERCATQNRAGFLRRLVESPACQNFISGADDERGKVLMREAEEAALPPPVVPSVAPLVSALVGGDQAADAQAEADWPVVAVLRRTLDAAGIGAGQDRYAALLRLPQGRQVLAGWTRDRWDRANAYIDAV